MKKSKLKNRAAFSTSLPAGRHGSNNKVIFFERVCESRNDKIFHLKLYNDYNIYSKPISKLILSNTIRATNGTAVVLYSGLFFDTLYVAKVSNTNKEGGSLMECDVKVIQPKMKDEFGPESIYEVFDKETKAVMGWVVIDNTARSPHATGKGGTAMYLDCDLEITMKKARVMTWKQVFCVPIGKKPIYEPWGGGKGGIKWDSARSDAKEVLKAWGRSLYDAQVIPARYIFGLDVGLKEWATRTLVQELGDRQVSTGKPTDLGGIPYDELGITGYGIALAMDLMGQSKGIDIKNPKTRIGVQGFGAVGYGTAHWVETLYPGGAKIVVASNEYGCLYSDDGFSSEELKSLLVAPAEQQALPRSITFLPRGSELYLPLDYLILAYKEDQITGANVQDIQASIVVEGANRGISDDAEKFLWRNGILSLTDFTINCGASSIVYVEYANGSVEDGLHYVREVITANTSYLLEELRNSAYSPRELAEEIAKSEVRNAMAKRMRL